LRFAEKGHRVFALSRDKEKLKYLKDKSGNKSFVVIPCDVENENSVMEAVKIISEEVNSIDILVNNSGRLIKKAFKELSLEEWKSVYGVNVFGLVNTTKMLLPLLMKGELQVEKAFRSHVVNISSMGGIQGSMKFNGLSAYSSSKGAVITLTECFSEEFKQDGISVNCIALGSVSTEMFEEAFPGMKASMETKDFSNWLYDFALNGFKYFNGKVIPVSTATP
jgi:3-oxoacyl-[acyl-carrier protein] reductase